MNANELIDELWACLESSIISDSDTRDLIMDAATMLRNLQDRIERQAGEYESLVRIKENLQAKNEALKAENKFFKDLMGDVEILRKAQEK